LLGRVAGDEFICVLRNCEPGEAAKLGEILRNEIDCLSVEARPEEYARVRLRYSVQECKEGQTVDDLLHAIAVAARKGRTTQQLHWAGGEPAESGVGESDGRGVGGGEWVGGSVWEVSVGWWVMSAGCWVVSAGW